MQQLILKNHISKSKMEALINFLKSWDIEAELQTISVDSEKKNANFSLSVGLWKDYEVEADELRKKAWNKNI